MVDACSRGNVYLQHSRPRVFHAAWRQLYLYQRILAFHESCKPCGRTVDRNPRSQYICSLFNIIFMILYVYYMNYISVIDTIVIRGTACVVVLPYTETGSMCRLFATCRPPHFSGHFQKIMIQLLREILPFQACRHIGINFSPGLFLVFCILKIRRKSSQHRQTIVFLAEDLNQEVELVTWNRKTDLV